MAKFQPILGTLAGSIAGNTWARNKGGLYLKRRAAPTNPTSIRQTAVRTVLSSLSGAWAALTSTQQQQWRDWAALHPLTDSLGQSFNMSGQQAYISLNARVLDAGGTAVATPPVTQDPVSLLTAVATAGAATVSVAYTTTPTAAGIGIEVWQTLPGSAGLNPNFAQARLCGRSAAAAASPGVITQAFPMLAGQYSNFYVATINLTTGQRSPFLKTRDNL